MKQLQEYDMNHDKSFNNQVEINMKPDSYKGGHDSLNTSTSDDQVLHMKNFKKMVISIMKL